MSSSVRKEDQPLPIYHPVTLNPTGDPAYVDGQVSDIMIELQEGPPLKPFIEGEPIPTPTEPLALFMFGVPTADYDRMMARVWVDHKHRPKRDRRREYNLIRKAGGQQFQITWLPELAGFRVRPWA